MGGDSLNVAIVERFDRIFFGLVGSHVVVALLLSQGCDFQGQMRYQDSAEGHLRFFDFVVPETGQ